MTNTHPETRFNQEQHHQNLQKQAATGSQARAHQALLIPPLMAPQLEVPTSNSLPLESFLQSQGQASNVISQCFIFNNGASLPWGTVKTEVLSTRNPKSEKSQHTAKSLITCQCLPCKTVDRRKPEQLKKQKWTKKCISIVPKIETFTHTVTHLHHSSGTLFEIKHSVMRLWSKAAQHRRDRSTRPGQPPAHWQLLVKIPLP